MKIDISKLDKAAVLQALYNNIGDPKDRLPWPVADNFRNSLFAPTKDKNLDIEILRKKKLGISISNDQVDVSGYEKEYGEGSASKALASLLNNEKPTTKLKNSNLIPMYPVGRVMAKL
jgi:hypothetical protein